MGKPAVFSEVTTEATLGKLKTNGGCQKAGLNKLHQALLALLSKLKLFV